MLNMIVASKNRWMLEIKALKGQQCTAGEIIPFPRHINFPLAISGEGECQALA
jgi:hypothetical protein